MNLTTEPRESHISMRIDPHTRILIDQAAKISGKSRSSFMIDAAARRACNIIMDQKFFSLEGDQWKKFNEALNNPPKPNQKLLKLLLQKAPWE